MLAKVDLELSADPGTEIFLIDSFLQCIKWGVGELRERVAPGIYKARFMSGSQIKDVMLDATVPGSTVRHSEQGLVFESPAPLVNSAKTHEYYMGPASQFSTQTMRQHGNGSSFFLFVRAEDENAPFMDPGLASLHDLHGNQILHLGEGVVDQQWGFACVNVELDPGTYRLRVNGLSAGTYEMFVTLSPGWQTQIFQEIEQFETTQGPVRSPSLRNATVIMARMGAGFDPSRPDLRLTEQARAGLVNGRRILDESMIQQLFNLERENPLLGIYAAHLLLPDRTPGRRPPRILVKVLDYLDHLIPGHPDVQALRIGISSKQRIQDVELHTPPMIRTGWDLVIAASRTRSEIVPCGSIADQVAPNLVDARPWLIFKVHEQISASKPSTKEEALNGIHELIALGPERVMTFIKEQEHMKGISTVQSSLLRTIASRNSFMRSGETSLKKLLDPTEDAQLLFNNMPSPSGATASAVVDLVRRVKDQV